MKDNIFKKEIMDYASKLDAVTNSCGDVVKSASEIVKDNDLESTVKLLRSTSELIKSENLSKDVKRLANALKDSIMKFYGYNYILEKHSKSLKQEDSRTLNELLEELNALIGLEKVKSKVNDLISFRRVQLLRVKHGLYSGKSTMHLAFTGNPGTGKTTVARIVGRIYKQIGLLSQGHFIEVSRTDLIAGYQGQTALKVKKVIEEAKGGVLFIDEAYSITENDHSDSYGRECLTELTKALEDYRDDLVVIVAGYTEPMNHFFESNPGLKSRFNAFIDFPDYSADELTKMFQKLCYDNNYVLTDKALAMIRDMLNKGAAHKDKNFANGRLVRNLYEDSIMNHARRVVKKANPNRSDLEMITCEDIPADYAVSEKSEINACV